ncbi:heavy-metal-associated domain-containing protein, putative copper metallochaperone CopZ [Campylobacter blaseri]|uniref:Heavy metal transport/detoxification protein n=1 Tax=Campylobacter blaseri TaxID=2042961 RepID=A0A2P8R2B7_9BACT|nr:cation transporter [Campylobacter blaseri]PSM52632.1 heavy metal transport/detoxification protein [Campylobacter blaseri]PSM54280.1 heavy metal transport/detoxification protein [Campylobacter blaseri]QKF85931.1 heavy-metal-associated domain-containing protein, putative copper metallochaperone CopZ [Campylobacter blaseri]
MKKFKVEGINCQNCANLIKNSLEDDFGKIEVNVADKEVLVDIKDEEISNFSKEINDLGFEFIKEIK